MFYIINYFQLKIEFFKVGEKLDRWKKTINLDFQFFYWHYFEVEKL